ncbi:MAG: FAD/NAD(P)-binding protein [Planctomycetaceae bacterium]|nr:FAD/NAD(P)-binding protein [Planctomycetaceae bacterium]
MDPELVSSLSPQVIAVVGSGFSGTLVTVNLARLARGCPSRIVLFERSGRFARGVAYGTSCPHHLLNVPAGMMSALVDEPDHFFSWLHARDPGAHRGTFAPRRLYGDYLEELISAAANTPGVTIDLIRDEIVDIVEEGPGPGLMLIGREGSLRADKVVLALGNPTPQDPVRGPNHSRKTEKYRRNPWDGGALNGLSENEPILLIGSGLTAVDLIVEARARGLKGSIIVVSRHGLLPFPHQSVPPRPHRLTANGTPLTARFLLRHVRREAQECESEGGNWRSVVDALRPVTQEIWHSLDAGEKKRFIRHLSSRWDVHRHRIAPEIARIIDDARADGQLTVIAGRIHSLEDRGDAVRVRILPRGKSEVETIFAHRVINCTGPSRDIRCGHSPLVNSLVERGICRPDPLSLGLEVSDVGALVAPDGEPSDRLYALGPLRRGRLWETTAVRELRAQAFELAHHLVGLSL